MWPMWVVWTRVWTLFKWLADSLPGRQVCCLQWCLLGASTCQ